MTYVYEGPSTLTTLAIAIIGGAVVVLCQELLNWWEARRDEGPGPVDAAVDGVPIEPRDDAPFPDGWHGTWTPSQEDVELGRALTRERFTGTSK